jgi:hypothetical protein
MWHVTYDYPRKEMAVTFACSFHNRHAGEVAQFLGREMTLEVSPRFCRTYSAEWKPEYRDKTRQLQDKASQAGLAPEEIVVPPEYSMKRDELSVSTHMANFIECMRSRETPRCCVDRAFQEAVALLMSVEAFRRERKVKWDAAKEEIL